MATLCGENEKVVSHACVNCPEGKTNTAGDDASGNYTKCHYSFGGVSSGTHIQPLHEIIGILFASMLL